MLNYLVGYSETEGHDFGWVVMASDLVGGTRFELVTSSVSGRSNGCSDMPLNAPEGTSPGRILPRGAWGCLKDCGEWLPLWLPLWRLGFPAAAQLMPGLLKLGHDTTSITAPPRSDRTGPDQDRLSVDSKNQTPTTSKQARPHSRLGLLICSFFEAGDGVESTTSRTTTMPRGNKRRGDPCSSGIPG